ncbi:aminotransferase class V-fold PLP-dependent enzyme [Mycolicibacterium goodii]|uniref:aminotransferase class V-fold PLP-dependent enzyme n=1 Tax=Mycolicibacterium goodii TaxID=134601 RepID=UPI000C261A86|nr:aminotransferase class V-fold PLP-dependent enzyme [Mycolicibacterium goodii]PJK20210.1 aminotransferase [Mycolicibacterium goodii]
MTRAAFGAEFAGAEGFLNSATYGLPPQFLVDALRTHIDEWQSGTLDAASFGEPVSRARAAYAALTGVKTGSVVLAGSTSAALGLVAASIADGSRVVVVAGEFTSTTFPFAAQAARGVTVTEVEPAALPAVAAEYDVVVAGLVQSADGTVLDTDALRDAVAGTETRTVIDVTQAVGWKRLELGWVDVAVASAYKWLLAPRGTAWMSLSDRVAERMTPHAANWWAGEEPWDAIYGLPLRLADGARRFDVSPAWFAVLGAGLTMPWLASLDPAAVESHAVGLANRLRHELELPPNNSAIVSIPIAGAQDRLRQAGIRAAVRAGAVRVGFHLYNTEDDLDRLLSAVGDNR